jgi:hypothetical protein
VIDRGLAATRTTNLLVGKLSSDQGQSDGTVRFRLFGGPWHRYRIKDSPLSHSAVADNDYRQLSRHRRHFLNDWDNGVLMIHVDEEESARIHDREEASRTISSHLIRTDDAH